MALIQGSSATDPRWANYQPGRALTTQEIALRSSAGAIPMSSRTNYNAANYVAPQPVSTQSNKNALFQSLGLGQEAPVGWNGPADATVEDQSAQLRNEIGSAWDAYLGSLSGMETDLANQNTAMTNTANLQNQASQNLITNQKASSLKDIYSTARNAFSAGNNYLGSLGAGDSSASNQYKYAIDRQQQQQIGDLNNFVNQSFQKLDTDYKLQTQQIAQWFAQQQSVLKQQIAQGALSKSQDLTSLSRAILDQAIQATNALKTNYTNQQNALLTWAANNSATAGQLQQNIAAIPQAMGQLQTFGGSAPIKYGGTATTTKTDIWGNPIPLA